MSSKTLEQLKKVIIQQIEEEKSDNLLFEEVKKALKDHQGRPINKRLETVLKKHFGSDYEIELERISSLIYINIKGPWKDQSDYRMKNGFHIHFGYSETLTYLEGNAEEKHSGFNYYGLSWGVAALKRIKENEKMLKSKKLEKLAQAIDFINEGKKILESKDYQSYYFPARYAVERNFNLREKD